MKLRAGMLITVILAFSPIAGANAGEERSGDSGFVSAPLAQAGRGRGTPARGPQAAPAVIPPMPRIQSTYTLIGARKDLTPEQVQLVDEVTDLLSEGDNRKVDEKLAQYIEKNGGDAKALFLRAVAVRGRGDPKPAKEFFAAVVAAAPGTPEGQAAELMLKYDDADNMMLCHKQLARLSGNPVQHKGIEWLNGIAALGVGHWSEAAYAVINTDLNFQPPIIDLKRLAGEVHFKMNNELGRRSREQVLEKVKDARNYEEYARTLASMQKLDEALGAIRKAVELDPKYAPAHYTLASIQLAQDKADEALASGRRAVEIEPNNPRANAAVAQALERLGKADEAYDYYRKAAMGGKPGNPKGGLMEVDQIAELPPDKVSVEVWKYLSDGKRTEAEDILRKVLERRPEDARIALMLGLCIRGAGNSEAPKPYFDKAFSLSPDSPDGELARLLRLSQDSTTLDPIYAICTLARQHLDDPFMVWSAAIASRVRGNNSDAVFYFGLVMEKSNVGTAWMHMFYANALDALNDPDLALPHRVMSAKMDPVERNYTALATTRRALRQFAEADAAYAKAAEMAPESAAVWIEWAQCLLDWGKPEAAITKCRRAGAIEPRNAKVYEIWGNSLKSLGKFQEAFGHFERVMELQPTSVAPVNAAAEMLEKLGQNERAAELRTRAREMK